MDTYYYIVYFLVFKVSRKRLSILIASQCISLLFIPQSIHIWISSIFFFSENTFYILCVTVNIKAYHIYELLLLFKNSYIYFFFFVQLKSRKDAYPPFLKIWCWMIFYSSKQVTSQQIIQRLAMTKIAVTCIIVDGYSYNTIT